MSDLFLEDIRDDFIGRIVSTIRSASWHCFQVLTKRRERMEEWSKKHALAWPKNVWFGVSIENSDYLRRIESLKRIPAKVRFVSFEPLLGRIELPPGSLKGIHWIIVGGESGRRARPMKREWVEEIYRSVKGAASGRKTAQEETD